MRRAAAMAAVAVVACLAETRPVYRPELMRAVDSDSDKVVEVVANDNLPAHEPRTIEPRVVSDALLASGLFLQDDAAALGPALATELARMEPFEQIRIVGWADDGPLIYYVLATGGRLRILYYRRGSEMSRYDAVIPPPIVAITTPPDPAAPAPPPAIDAGVAAPPLAGTDGPARVARRPRHPGRARPPPISERDARAKIGELDSALHAGLITRGEHRVKRKDILSRL